MITYNQPMPVRQHYTDKKVFETLGFLFSNPECQYIAVRDAPFRSKKGGSKLIKKVTKKSTKKKTKKGSRKTSRLNLQNLKKTSKKPKKVTKKL